LHGFDHLETWPPIAPCTHKWIQCHAVDATKAAAAP
jgi:hypothetical protein